MINIGSRSDERSFDCHHPDTMMTSKSYYYQQPPDPPPLPLQNSSSDIINSSKFSSQRQQQSGSYVVRSSPRACRAGDDRQLSFNNSMYGQGQGKDHLKANSFHYTQPPVPPPPMRSHGSHPSKTFSSSGQGGQMHLQMSSVKSSEFSHHQSSENFVVPYRSAPPLAS